MPWLKMDDGFITHPKVLSVSAEAKLLWMWALGFCAKELTDGRLTQKQAVSVAGLAGVSDWKPAAAELIQARLWESDGDGYHVHDYFDYNPSKAEVEADRAARADAGRLGGQHTQAAKRAKREADAQASALADAQASAKAKSNPVPVTRTRSPGPLPVPFTPHGANAPADEEKPALHPVTKTKSPARVVSVQGHEPLRDQPARPDQAMFSALVENFGPPETDSQRGRYNRAGSELRRADPPVLPEHIPKIKAIYEQRWPKVDCTPTALAANLGVLRGGNGGQTSGPAERNPNRAPKGWDGEYTPPG